MKIEVLKSCPICQCEEVSSDYKNLTDVTFKAVDGLWNFCVCKKCNSGYLKNRLTIDSIGAAYENYYTHSSRNDVAGVISFLKRKITSGYIDGRFKKNNKKFFNIFYYASLFLSKNRKSSLDNIYRHLPKKINGKILDIGCGNGDFLVKAKNIGWDVIGIDPDVGAVENALRNGINARVGGIDILGDDENKKFAIITANHVIEHVHDPLNFLKKCNSVLCDDGYIWIETPNISSQGFSIYGENWRGLEIPRHLILFNEKTLIDVLKEAGFARFEIMPYRPLCRMLFEASESIASDEFSLDTRGFKLQKVNNIKNFEKIAEENSASREFITIKAWKF